MALIAPRIEPIEDDLESYLLISRLVLEDFEVLQQSQKGKSKVGSSLTDGELAIQEEKKNWESLVTAIEDHRIAVSVQAAIDSDIQEIEALSALEQAERDDRAAAEALAQGQPLPHPTDAQRILERTPLSLNNLKDHDSDIPCEDHGTTPELREFAVNTELGRGEASSSGKMRLSCVICTEDIVAARSLRAPCGHYYCRKCIVELVEAASRDESLYPIRCCQQLIPAEHFNLFLSPILRSAFCSKSIEFGTLSNKRVYCANPRCSTFLGPSAERRGDLVCPVCHTMVCTQCKNTSHPNESCTENIATLELKALARSQHWQTCPGCGRIVELHYGCNHITCRCRAEFCYVCAARWKTCTCPQWDETRLVNDAERRVINQFGQRAAVVAPVAHIERVQQAVAELRINHDCVQHHWTYRHGGGFCEECRSHLPLFMMRCTNCQILTCKRCSRNRL